MHGDVIQAADPPPQSCLLTIFRPQRSNKDVTYSTSNGRCAAELQSDASCNDGVSTTRTSTYIGLNTARPIGGRMQQATYGSLALAFT